MAQAPFFASTPSSVYQAPSLEFVSAPGKLPTLNASRLNECLEAPEAIVVHSNRNLQWLWLLPAMYFVLGGLLTLNTVMAQSVVPVMAEREAQEKSLLIRLVVDDFESSSSQEAMNSSQATPQYTPAYTAIKAEQFMEEPGQPEFQNVTATDPFSEAGSKKKGSFQSSSLNASNAAGARLGTTKPAAFLKRSPAKGFNTSRRLPLQPTRHSMLTSFEDVSTSDTAVHDMIEALKATREANLQKQAEEQAVRDAALAAELARNHKASPVQDAFQGNVAHKGGLKRPLLRLTLSSPYGPRWGRMHEGADFSAPSGTAIHSAGSGKVIFAGSKGAYGLLVIVDHGNGLKTRYGHCSSIHVKRGQVVQQGQFIAKVGSTGRSTGPHLHFEVRQHGFAKNPFAYMNA
jgi:murein DD-endopeptidase MepM/ murein hydrolase activator NlpD